MGAAGTAVARFLCGSHGVSTVVTKICRRLMAEVREFQRWDAFKNSEDIRTYYGLDRLPSREGPISGGIVKCLDLADRFPNSSGKANLLYLVSSALPDRRELLARAAHRAGGKVVLNQNGVAYPAWAGTDWRKRNAPIKRVYAAADFVVYQSEFCRRCAQQFLGAREGPAEVLFNPVDAEKFSPRKDLDQNNRLPVLMVAGSHHEAYRVKTVIEAVALYIRWQGTPVRLIVAGRLVWGPNAETESRRWAHESGLGEDVAFSGPYSQAEAPTLFRKADALIHLKVQDPCPRLVVEAMACGVPVLYSASGGTVELVGDEAGIGIPQSEDFQQAHPPAVEAVADAITSLLANRGALARQARARALRMFSVDKWLDAHQRIFESLAVDRNG